MIDDRNGVGGQPSGDGDLIEIDLNFESMRRFQAEFSPNLSKDGIFIDTGEPLDPGSVVRFRVILPEDFVFLEGTAIVEWCRDAERVTEGAPGMALRFATLSSQNQELVEQLVQDYADAGGVPFDLDVRPVLGDFPTDALEGAPARDDNKTQSDGYRLTVRHTGPALQEEALQALVDASPNGGAPDPEAVEEEQTHGFEIVSASRNVDGEEVDEPETTPDETPEKPIEAVEETPVEKLEAMAMPPEEPEEAEVLLPEGPVEAVGEPPELEWPEEDASADVDGEVAQESAPIDVEPVAAAGQFDWEGAEPDIELEKESVEESVSDPVVLETPSDFDDGPEVMEEVVGENLGSPAFEVSLPVPDDEPDTTPVLPDEGQAEVTVRIDDEPDQIQPRGRAWPYVLAAVFVLAIVGGFLSPRVASWLESRDTEEAQVASAGTATDQLEAASSPVDQEPGASNETEAEPDMEAVEGGQGDAGEAADEPPAEEAASDSGTIAPIEPEPTPVPEPESEPVRLAAARTIESIDVASGPRGTVVTIRADGSLGDGVLSVEPLTSPPRLLVRLRGIETSYRPYLIEHGSPEVATIRMGHHGERRPPELWVVVDLVGDGPGMEGIDIRGEVAELVIADR